MKKKLTSRIDRESDKEVTLLVKNLSGILDPERLAHSKESYKNYINKKYSK